MSPLTRQHVTFGGFALLIALLNVDQLWALAQLALINATVSHVVAVPFVTLLLIYGDRDIIFNAVRPGRVAGGCLALAGVALSILAPTALNLPTTTTLTVGMTGVALAWTGGFVMIYGVASARAALFPLAFLVFMIPMPDAVVEGATQFLKSGSSEAVAGLFTLTGTPFHREGFVFSLPSFAIEIADECSGIRSSIALLLTGLLAGHRFLQKPWTKIALVLLILPITVIKNAIRIVALSLLAMHVDPSFLTGQLHHEGGFVFFLLALGLLAPLFVLLKRSEGTAPEPVSQS
jgi:exosortase